MSAINWVIIGGASGIVGVVFLEKLADDYGFQQVRKFLRGILPLVTAIAGLKLIGLFLEVFVK